MRLDPTTIDDFNINIIGLTKKEKTTSRLEALISTALKEESNNSTQISNQLNKKTQLIQNTTANVFNNAFKISIVALFVLSIALIIIPGGAPVGAAIALAVILLYPNLFLSLVTASIAESLTKAYLTTQLKEPKELQASDDKIKELTSLKNYFTTDIYKDDEKDKETVISWLDKLFLDPEFTHLMTKIESSKDLNDLKKLKDLIEQKKKEQYNKIIINDEQSINS